MRINTPFPLTNISSTFIPLSLVLTIGLAGCASTPKDNATLTQARSGYEVAQADPAVVKYAPIELKAAGDAIGTASNALQEREKASEVEHLSYLAKQKVEIARETARLKVAEEQIKTAGADRDKVLLQARTAEADRLRNELNAKQTDRGMTMTLGDVLFDTGKARLKSGSQRSLQKLAQFLTENPQRHVAIEGFTDNVGGDDFNQDLSERRADAVRDALVGMGVSSDRISARGYGKAFPVAGNEAAAGRQLNRRVEIIIASDNKEIAPR
ncbi:MAG TPA: OmpA family protein [Spongiibacteraceae bacterium]|nr:OmpA family protein [Spongiibacteraceae bacterium]